jgi:hypothetical protein
MFQLCGLARHIGAVEENCMHSGRARGDQQGPWPPYIIVKPKEIFN